MTDDSFTYNGIDMFQQFKIKVLVYDLFTAERRQRKLTIPGRSGAYDFDADEHEERPLRMDIEITGEISDAQLDSLKYTLSRKGRIVLWDKPDRYYIGRLYDPAEVIDYFRHCKREFEINFLCEPYAYAVEPTVISANSPIMPVKYIGTRRTPTRITITNNSDSAMRGLTITAREIA